MVKFRKIVSLVLVISLLLLSFPGLALGKENPTDLLTFDLLDDSNVYHGDFNEPGSEFYQSITVTVPEGTDKSSLKVIFEKDPAAKVSLLDSRFTPKSEVVNGDPIDYTNGVYLEVSLTGAQSLSLAQIKEVTSQDLDPESINSKIYYVQVVEEGTQPQANKSLLIFLMFASQLIHDLSSEGTEPGQVSPEARAALQTAIDQAWEIYGDVAATQAAVDTAIVNLGNALTALEDSMIPLADTTALSEALDSAFTRLEGATEGTNPGEHAVGSKAALEEAINSAIAVLIDPSSTQDEVDAATKSLIEAIAAFDAALIPAPPVDKTSLTNAITSAQGKLAGATEGANPGDYAAGSKAALQAAIDSAAAVKNNASATQAEVDAATNSLNQAIAAFDAAKVPESNSGTTPAPAYPGKLIKNESTGQNVKDLQAKLKALGYDCGPVDGIFGPKTKAAVLAFQANSGLARDGVVGPLTWGKLFGADSKGASGPVYSGLVMFGMTGSNVKAVQEKLNSFGYNAGPVDGIFGPKTLQAVKSFQAAKGLAVDGIVGIQTWSALF